MTLLRNIVESIDSNARVVELRLEATMTHKYPADAAERALLREQLIAEGRQRGELEAQRLMRTLNCSTRFELYGENHEPCLNDGTGCLDATHDRVMAEVTR
jgi:hypothetical protein